MRKVASLRQERETSVSARREVRSESAEGAPQTTESSQPLLGSEKPRCGHPGNGSYAEYFVGGEAGSGHVRSGHHGVDASTLANPLSVHQSCKLPRGDRGEPACPRTDSFGYFFEKEAVPNEADWKDLCRQASIEQDPEKVLELVMRILELLDKKKEQPGTEMSY